MNLLLIVLFSSLILVQAMEPMESVDFDYRLLSIEARTAFLEKGGRELVNKFPNQIYECGQEHLLKDKPDTTRYQDCVKSLEIPDSDFKTKVFEMKSENFASSAIFVNFYQRNLIQYAMSLDKDNQDSFNNKNLKFKFNFVALLIIPAGFLAVFLINKYLSSKKRIESEPTTLDIESSA
jgi:hypothetical protein